MVAMGGVAVGERVLDGPAVGERVLDGPVPESLERLEARICSAAAGLASSTCEWLLMVAEFDRRSGWAQWGLKSCAHWLSWACSVSPVAAREHVRVARSLGRLPLITGEFAAGRLSYSKVKAVTRAVGVVPEETLLEQALVHTASQLERVVRAFGKTGSAGRSPQDRRKARWFFDDDGMLVFTARLPADEGAMLIAALQQAEHGLGMPPGGEPDCPAEAGSAVTKDSDQVGWDGADAVVALAQNALAAGPQDSSGDDRTLVVLHVDADVLAQGAAVADAPAGDRSAAVGAGVAPVGRCHLQDGPGVSGSTARRLACDSSVIAVVRSSLGRFGRGKSLRLGRRTRQISPALRRALRFRDDGCQHPGCHRRRHLHAHHVVHWADGGPTDLDNLILVCRFHHMQVHEAGWMITAADPADGAGRWVFTRPDGTPVPAVPDLGPAVAASDSPQGPAAAQAQGWDPELIRPGWRGERFSLANSVGLWCRAADGPTVAPVTPVDPFGPFPSTDPWLASGYTDRGYEGFLAREDKAFYADVKINDFSDMS